MKVLGTEHLIILVLVSVYLIALFLLLILNTVNIARALVSSFLAQRKPEDRKRKNSNHSLLLLFLLYPCFFSEIIGSVVLIIEYIFAEVLPGGWRSTTVAALTLVNFGLRGIVTYLFNICIILQVSFVFAKAEHMARLNATKESQFKVYKGIHIAGTVVYIVLNTLHMTATLVGLYYNTVSPGGLITILAATQFAVGFILYISSMLGGSISLLVTGIRFTRMIKSTNKIQKNNNVSAAFKKVCLLLLLLESYSVFHVVGLVCLAIAQLTNEKWLVPYYLLLQGGELIFMFGLNLIHSPLYALGSKVTQAVGSSLKNTALRKTAVNRSPSTRYAPPTSPPTDSLAVSDTVSIPSPTSSPSTATENTESAHPFATSHDSGIATSC